MCRSDGSLCHSLKPLWILTQYMGVLPSWCHQVASHQLSSVASWISIVLVLLLLISMTVFQTMQLGIQFWKSVGIHSIVPNFPWFFPLPIAVIIQLVYLLRRRTFLTYFNDWDDLEQQLRVEKLECNIGRIRSLFYSSFSVISLFSLTGIAYLIITSSHESYLLTYYQVFQQPEVFPWAVILQVMSVTYATLISCLADLAPSFVYYHASLAIRVLSHELESSFVESDRIRIVSPRNFPKQVHPLSLQVRINNIWNMYERVRQMVSRANRIFGSLMILDHSQKLFFICSMAYTVLYGLKTKETVELVTYSIVFLFFTYRLVSCVLLASELSLAVVTLRSRLFYLLSCNWTRMSEKDHEISAFLLHHLQDNRLAPSPWDLYDIKPTLLLTILSLIVTYVIILLQSP